MVRCTGIRMSAGTRHEHITHIRWVNPSTNATDLATRQAMVEYVQKGNVAFVLDKHGHRANLAVRTSSLGHKYVQTYADGIWTDNLLALPRV